MTNWVGICAGANFVSSRRLANLYYLMTTSYHVVNTRVMCLSVLLTPKVSVETFEDSCHEPFRPVLGIRRASGQDVADVRIPGPVNSFHGPVVDSETFHVKHACKLPCCGHGHDDLHQHAMNAPNASSLTSPSSNADYLLRRCWRFQDCHSCLRTSDPCSWCAVSSTCIPNEVPVAVFAPIWEAAVCPLKEERWELRAKGTGCRVSTVTLLGLLVAIAGTAIVALSIWALFHVWAWSRRRWRKDRLGLRSLKAVVKRVWSGPWAWHKTAKENMHNTEAESEQTRLLA